MGAQIVTGKMAEGMGPDEGSPMGVHRFASDVVSFLCEITSQATSGE